MNSQASISDNRHIIYANLQCIAFVRIPYVRFKSKGTKNPINLRKDGLMGNVSPNTYNPVKRQR